MNCERCGSECEICPFDWPYNPNFWICSECDSTFVFDEEEEKMQIFWHPMKKVWISEKEMTPELRLEISKAWIRIAQEKLGFEKQKVMEDGK